jgi:hypothetical protein
MDEDTPRWCILAGFLHSRVRRLWTNTLGKTPPVMRRGLQWFLAGSAVLVVLAIGVEVARDLMGIRKTRWITLATMAIGWTPFLVLLPIWRWRTLSLRRLVTSTGFRVCIHCGYDLSSLPESGTCPECGKQYEIEAVREVWKRSGMLVPPAQTGERSSYHRGS